jgi:glycolate oxidase FAD binding subunit
VETLAPTSTAEAAHILSSCDGRSEPIRFVGGGTKLDWGEPSEEAPVCVSSRGMARVVEHNAGDLTAVVGAGVGLAHAQEEFTRAGQMLALDPPSAERATVGGVVATNDTGPLRHRYGAIRDLVLGVTVVLADGTVAKSGGKVIKNVAGYDLGKLFTGSFGTLGYIAEVALRLHPVPPRSITVIGEIDDPDVLGRAAIAAARLPVELDCLDFGWSEASGRLLARLSGAEPEGRARRVIDCLEALGLSTGEEEDDDGLWDEQRRAQRSAAGVVIRVAGLPADIARLVSTGRRYGASIVGRAGLGIAWLSIGGEADDPVGAVEAIRTDLRPYSCVVTDAAPELRRKVGTWDVPDEASMTLFRRIKERFDPNNTCNRGVFVGEI